MLTPVPLEIRGTILCPGAVVRSGMEDLIVLSIRGKDNAFLLSGIFGFAGADAADLVDSLTAYRTQPVGIESGSGAITTHRLAANDNLIGLWFSVFISSNGKDCNRPPSLRY